MAVLGFDGRADVRPGSAGAVARPRPRRRPGTALSESQSDASCTGQLDATGKALRHLTLSPSYGRILEKHGVGLGCPTPSTACTTPKHSQANARPRPDRPSRPSSSPGLWTECLYNRGIADLYQKRNRNRRELEKGLPSAWGLELKELCENRPSAIWGRSGSTELGTEILIPQCELQCLYAQARDRSLARQAAKLTDSSKIVEPRAPHNKVFLTASDTTAADVAASPLVSTPKAGRPGITAPHSSKEPALQKRLSFQPEQWQKVFDRPASRQAVQAWAN